MSPLIDIINFNPDASCLDSARWLACLSGGSESLFYKWLSLYVLYQKPVVLGMTGSLISDLLAQNPHSIELIKQNKNIFQIILRPYTHDIALLRTSYGFEFNFLMGKTVIESVFDKVSPFYLPPEFMLRSEHIKILADAYVTTIFINSDRYSSDIACRIPKQPYRVKGVAGSQIGCIPVNGCLTKCYLNVIQSWDVDSWNRSIANSFGKTQKLWRDGESCFLLPDSIEREEYWLKNCTAERLHLPEYQVYEEVANTKFYSSYPPHSFAAWMREFRMISFIHRIREIENSLNNLSKLVSYWWLMAINSDVLSAVEKSSPIIQLRDSPHDTKIHNYTLFRSERGYEGEDYLFALEQCIKDEKNMENIYQASGAHLAKAICRIQHLQDLFT